MTWAKNGKKKVVWRCVSRLDHGTKYCKHSPTLDEEALHAAILAAVNNIKRNLTKINYRIHTDAIKENLIPVELTPQQISHIYASEADVLNVALFGMTAKQWRDSNPELKGNIRDYANVSQLVCLSNMENLNAIFIGDGMLQSERLKKLNAVAISQMKLLTEDHRVSKMEGGHASLPDGRKGEES